MVKDKARVEDKMRRNVRAAGPEVKAGMEAAESPIDVLLKDPTKSAQKLQDGVAEAIRTGKYKQGLDKAASRKSWEKSIDRAAENYAKSAERMVENSMEDYDARAGVIASAQKSVENMPTTTTDQRIDKSAAYQKAAHKGFNTLYGRKD